MVLRIVVIVTSPRNVHHAFHVLRAPHHLSLRIYVPCCRPEFSPFRPSTDPSSTSSHNAQNSHLEGKPKGRTLENIIVNSY